ncbi:MFS general substrate transporter [Ganoderma leucocontextum]|nr:MFS general substrate transporter [Ganoderma leucocontextum]
MPFGILEDRKLDNVPGTGLLSDRGKAHGPHGTIDDADVLKHGTGNYSHIILIPQPSDDPRDPLNWPRWKKEACFWSLIFATSLAGVLSPVASAGYVLLAKQFDVSVDEITSSFGALLLGLGIFMLVQNTLAVKYGHRIVFLLSTFLMFISCVWNALSPDLASIRAARIFQGFGMAAPQCLAATTLEHIYFVHERGSRSIIWNFSLMAGITLGPLVYSYVIQNLSWQLGFWFASIACGLSFVGVFFFVPETTYRRQAPVIRPKRNHDESSSDKGSITKTPRTPGTPDVEIRTAMEQDAATPHPPTFLSQLKIYSGTFSDESVWKIFLRPLPLILSPVTWFVFLAYAMQTVWLSLVPLCSSTIFTIEYDFNAAQIGLTNLGGIVGIVLAMLVTGPLNDWGIVWMSQRNHGVYEPEYRLIFMLGMLFGVFGYIGWAVGNDHHMPWIGAVACITMLNFSMVVSGGAAVTYLLDTHGGANALHVLSVTNFAKNMVLYGSTFFANGVVVARGVKASLLILGACQAVCWLAAVPMYVYGKRVRSFIARHPRFFRGSGDLPASDLPEAGSERGATEKL